MMSKISKYRLWFNPFAGEGQGYVDMIINGRSVKTNLIGPSNFAAVASLLAQKNIHYDPQSGQFSADDADSPIAALAEMSPVSVLIPSSTFSEWHDNPSEITSNNPANKTPKVSKS